MSRLGIAFSTWLENLGRVLPLWALLPGFQKYWSRPFYVASLPLGEEKGNGGLEDLTSGAAYDVVLAENCVLVRNIAIPKTGRKRVEAILELDLKKALPGQQSRVEWRNEFVKRNGKELVFRQFVIKKSSLAELSASLKKHGVLLRKVGIEGHDKLKPLIDNRFELDKPVRRWWGGVFFLLILGCSIWVAGEFYALREAKRVLAQHQEELRELRTAVVKAMQEKEGVSEEYASVLQAVAQFNRQATPLRALSGITDAFSSDTWVSEFDLRDLNLHLSGFTAGDISDLVEGLRSLDWVKTVELTSPLVLDRRTQRSRFELSIELEETAP